MPIAIDAAHAGGGRRVRPRPQGRRARQELLGARPFALALRPVARRDRQVDRAALRQGAGAPRRQPRRAEGGLRLRRDDGAFAPRGRRPEACAGAQRPLAHDVGHRRDGARRRRGRSARRTAGLLLLLSDHPGLGAASCARQAQGRRQDFSGRGRDRRRLRGDRRFRMPAASASPPPPARPRAEDGSARTCASPPSCRWSSSTCSAPAPRPACRPSPSSPTSTWRSSAATAKSPLPVLAPATPGDCFDIVIDAARIAIEAMTPVIVLSDAYLANAISDWEMPSIDDLPALRAAHRRQRRRSDHRLHPRSRDARTPMGGAGNAGPRPSRRRASRRTRSPATSPTIPTITKRWCGIRAEKIARVANRNERAMIHEGADEGDLLVVAWGSTYGPVRQAVRNLARGRPHGRRICICGSSGRFPPGSKQSCGATRRSSAPR